MLLHGEIDFDKESDLAKQDQQNDFNTDIRSLIVKNLPALTYLLLNSEETAKEGVHLAQYRLLPMLNDLIQDRNEIVRAQCALAFPTVY